MAIGTILLSNIGAHFISLERQMPIKPAQRDNACDINSGLIMHCDDKNTLFRGLGGTQVAHDWGIMPLNSDVLHIVRETV
ncbi:hypothetical protein K3169_12445 [Pseudomonas phytophila]|uniref:Uncharacterized protein n=1 Tax=Pseudomonas phytophila TaxID=2867264 RepID=A0ABY6FL20_9PSED|nr:hypothetical protein [Pseudomonas phytophila]UXZ98608.1 hypothetical protein K3169_12445 [Pseudomonas phytophila]